MKAYYLIFMALITLVLASCGGSSESNSSEAATETESDDSYKPEAETRNIGIGPVKHVDLGAIDATRVQLGKEAFEAKCTSCHKFSDEKYVGPGLKGITKRREPEWIMNMIINPDKMTTEDPVAKELLAEHLTQMTNQNITEEQARNILEYFRQQDAGTN